MDKLHTAVLKFKKNITELEFHSCGLRSVSPRFKASKEKKDTSRETSGKRFIDSLRAMARTPK